MSVFTHHRRFHKGRHHTILTNQKNRPDRSRNCSDVSGTQKVRRSQAYRLYCQPFSSQLSKAKTSEGHFQSQIDHSTQGKPLKKASRRPREQNCLCSGRPISNPAVRKPAIKPARLLAPGCPGRITRRQTTWRGPYRPTPFVRRPHVARNTNRIFDIYLIRNLWTLLESWLVSVKLGRVY